MPKKIVIENKDTVLGWHVLPKDMKLCFGDGRIAVPGAWIQLTDMKLPVILCSHGLHASRKVTDALFFARILGDMNTRRIMLCRVRIGGETEEDHDKFCGQYRKILWCFDIRKVLKAYMLKMGVSKSSIRRDGILHAMWRFDTHSEDAWIKHDAILLLKMINKEAKRLDLIGRKKKNGKGTTKSRLSKKGRRRRR